MRKKEKPVAFQFYPRDYLADVHVEVMTIEEEGIYIRLLAYCWLEKFLPNDLKVLCQLAKGATPEAVGTVVRTCFKIDTKDDTKIFHPRLELERKKQHEWSQKSSDAGKKSAKARQVKKLHGERWLTNGSTKRQPAGSTLVEPNGNSSSSSSSSFSSLAAAAAIPTIVEPVEPVELAAAAEPTGAIHFPESQRLIQQAFPGTDSGMTTRIIAAACRCKANASDRDVVELLIRTHKGKRQESAGLWLHTIPAYLATVANGSNHSPPVCPECGGTGEMLNPECHEVPDDELTKWPPDRIYRPCPRCRGDTLRKPAESELQELVYASAKGAS